MKKTLQIFSALAALALAAAAPDERTWDLKIAGQPSGSYTETTTPAAEGRIRTKEIMALELNRLGSKIVMRTENASTEDADGKLLALESTVSSSQTSTEIRARRTADGFEVETKAGEKSYSKQIPAKGEVLGPKGLERRSREGLKKAGDTLAFQMFSPELGSVVAMQRKAIGQAGHDGRRLLEIEETIEGLPGKQIVLLDEMGRWVRRQQPLPFGEMVIEPASAKAAPAAPATAQGSLPAESYDRTMARSNVPLPDPRSISRLKLKLRHHKPELGWPDLDSAHQRVLEKTDDTRVIEVHQTAATAQPKPDESFLRPNALVQSDDPEIVRLAQEVTKGATSDFEKARRLQDWVNRNLELDLGIVLAPASEVVRNRRGTCIAYATLLAALERAAGLPSRIAMGYAYVSGIWGGHAWSEVFLEDRWVALDAALYSPGPADAARLWFGATSGDDQMMKAIAGGAQMYGAVDFAVLSLEREGKTVTVPADAKPYEVKGNRYTNPWLGFSVSAPSGFRFEKLDAVFPERTVLEMDGGKGGKVVVSMSGIGAEPAAAKKSLLAGLNEATLQKKTIGALEGELATSENAACLLWRRGHSLWAIRIEGENAGRTLEQIARDWQWTR